MKKKISLIVFTAILLILLLASIVGVAVYKDDETLLQGQIESVEISISGTLPGRVEKYYVEEGQRVEVGDTLVIISSPQAEAKYNQAKALESASLAQNEKVDAGTRIQLINIAKEIWNKAKSDLELAKHTRERMNKLYEEKVISIQRKDEIDALYQSALSEERAAYYQYEMAKAGMQEEDKATSYSIVMAAQSTVDEVVSVLKDAALTSPISGEVGAKYLNESELVGVGTPLMKIIMIDECYLVLNIREDMMPNFRMGETIYVDIPAIDSNNIPFKINYISPMGSFATWKSTKEKGSYDLKTFELHAKPTRNIKGLRPGMSVLLYVKKK
ncbi:MAG: HlyD family efflux transporter periplasmic adaptor subunit [Bacteroidales bacterium]|nr:HlyD family efflux transporter periplasmic adaptor subunit [Bacteroidales bacterium]